MGTEAVKLVYFGSDEGTRQAFWRMPDGKFEPVRNEGVQKLYLKDRGAVRLIQG